MTLPVNDTILEALEDNYPLRGVWVVIDTTRKKEIASLVDGAIKPLAWIESPFVDGTVYNNILPIYSYLLGRVADNVGEIGFFFDENDPAYIMFDRYLTSPRPKSTDRSSSGGGGTNPVNTGRIAPIEYV